MPKGLSVPKGDGPKPTTAHFSYPKGFRCSLSVPKGERSSSPLGTTKADDTKWDAIYYVHLCYPGGAPLAPPG